MTAGILLLLLSYPLISIFNRPVFVAGIPLLYLYVLLVWVGIVLLLAFYNRRHY
jgi:hypothetical protein